MLQLEYYNRPFRLFYLEIGSKIKTNSNYLRRSFWSLVPPGEYRYIQAQDLFWAYSKSIQQKAAELVKKYSIEYWMHLSRRIGIGTGGLNKELITININRFLVLALIQKYAQQQRCVHVQNSDLIKISDIFNGLLMSEEFALERQIIESSPGQLVFTDFTSSNLLEYYNLENFAYELWMCGAKLRSIGKGVTITVRNDSEDFFFEKDHSVLDELISSYDSRLSHGMVTEAGTIFSNEKIDSKSEILIPILNVYNIPLTHLNSLFEHVLNLKFEGGQSNFLLFPYPIQKYIESHRPLNSDFVDKYGVNFVSVIVAFSALCFRSLYLTVVEKQMSIIRILMRGYDGPHKKTEILNEMVYFAKHFCEQIKEPVPNEEELIKAFNFLELNDPQKVDINNPGTLKLFLKSSDEYYFIDYSTLPYILSDLFEGLDLNKYDYRGPLFEKSIGYSCYLPTTPCKSNDGSKKQIDFSYVLEDILLIGECKVVARKNSYYLGSFSSLRVRQQRVVEKGIKEVDEKAKWLVKNPKGTNYDISEIKYILPVAISPFVEYIHSTNRHYWINDEVPRVLSINELRTFIEEFDRKKVKYNLKELEILDG